jgi:hypothetical protein
MLSRAGANGNYAIGFEVRMPVEWNGRFYYQANGGTDGSVGTATGGIGGGGPLGNALDSVAVGQIFQSPPQDAASFVGPTFAATGNVDQMFV